jgi:Holliday junction resolvase
MARHLAQSKERDLIALSYEAIGHDYEDVIEQIVRQIGWKIKKLDSAKRQGVPDFEIIEGGKSILVECKTKKRDDAAIDKDDAFDVLTKGVDFDADHYITIGKPDFDFFSKSKAAGSTKITLVANYSFIAAFLRWKEGKLKAIDFFSWLTTPGVASIENLREQ